MSVSRKDLTLFWAICFLFYFLIMWCAPFTYDDYEFASLKFPTAADFFQYCLTYGNGRFLGNISGVLSNQYPVVGAIYKALCLSTTVILIPEILGVRNKFSLALSFVLITAIDPSLFAQVYTWTSGFANYVPAVFLMLAILWLIQRYPGCPGNIAAKILLCISLFALSCSAQLFIEHSSIVNLILAILVVMKAHSEAGKSRLLPAFMILAGAAAGLCIMFWIPGHFVSAVNNHTAGYRSMHIGNLYVFVFNCARNALRLTNHYLGACGLPLCIGSTVTVYLTQHKRTDKANQLLYLMSGFSGIYLLVCTLLDTEAWYGEPAIIHHAIAMICVLASLAAWLIALIQMEDKLLRNKLFVLLGLAVFSLLPLLVVTPIHIRVLYHSQMFVVIACLLTLCKWSDSWTALQIRNITKLLLGGALALILALVPVFLSIQTMDHARNRYILSQIEQNADSVELFRMPYKYVHDATDSAMGDYYYREERRDIQFHFIPYDQWMNDHLDAGK